MSTKLSGKVDLTAIIDALPGALERNVLRGGLRAAADVYADGAREECRSPEVRATIKTSSRAEKGFVTAKVQTKGPGSFKAPWLEYGTSEHYISVDDEAGEGRTVRRINTLVREGSLVIGGKFVGRSVLHPGARPYPFFRPAVDTREQQAVDAFTAYVVRRATKEGIFTPAPEEPDE